MYWVTLIAVVTSSGTVSKGAKCPVLLSKLNPRPTGFSSSDNYGNFIKNYLQDGKDGKKQTVDKNWILYQYSPILAHSYIDKFQRMLYAPVLIQPGVYTVRYCLDAFQVKEETNHEYLKNLALKSSKCYYYVSCVHSMNSIESYASYFKNRDMTVGGTTILTHLAALASPEHVEEFGNDDLHRRFVKIFLSYLKEVELKHAKWINDTSKLFGFFFSDAYPYF